MPFVFSGEEVCSAIFWCHLEEGQKKQLDRKVTARKSSNHCDSSNNFWWFFVDG